MLLLALSCVCDCDTPTTLTDTDSDTDTTSADTGVPSTGAVPDGDTWPLSWDDDPCAGLPEAGSDHTDTIARWVEQDDAVPPPTGGTVVVGSSSIRRWQRLSTDFSGWGVIQRGFGGAWLSEVAVSAPDLITRHQPRAVVVFAGTNDIAGGSLPEDVVTAYRCLTQKVWQGVGAVPVLFVDDLLHLNGAGYALWSAVIEPAVAAAVAPDTTAPDNPDHPPSGTRVLIDLGPANAEDGTHTTSPDANGLTWNNWQPVEGSAAILPGEAIRDLRSTTGEGTGFSMVVGGGFVSNGLLNGGLSSPDPAHLGDLAVSSATGDFFYVDGPDNPGALTIGGLEPDRAYSLRLFGSRDWGSEDRITGYTVTGASVATTTLQTSGPGLGDSTDGNETDVAVFTEIAPDDWGRLHIDLTIDGGSYAYLNLLEMAVE